MLEVRNATYINNGRALVSDISLHLKPGSVCALLGPNGAGKSTLLKIMSGQLKATCGEVLLNGRPIEAYMPAQLAKLRGVLSQSRSVGFPFNVFDVAMMGRHPQLSGRGETPADRAKVNTALEDTESDHLAHRIYNTLSGGEAARVDLARVLAQETPVLLLDEPTNHLDPRHQVAVLRLCRQLARNGLAVAVCMHDLNLAAQYADQVLVMKEGRAEAQGSTAANLTSDLLGRVYEIPFSVWERPSGGLCILPEEDWHCSHEKV
jgi:iron complex transport system ATP-binding protein